MTMTGSTVFVIKVNQEPEVWPFPYQYLIESPSYTCTTLQHQTGGTQ